MWITQTERWVSTRVELLVSQKLSTIRHVTGSSWSTAEWNLKFRFSVTFSAILRQLYLAGETGVPGENDSLTPSYWQLSQMPRSVLEPRQWWETASSQWQPLRPLDHQGRPSWNSAANELASVLALYLFICRKSLFRYSPMKYEWDYSTLWSVLIVWTRYKYLHTYSINGGHCYYDGSHCSRAEIFTVYGVQSK